MIVVAKIGLVVNRISVRLLPAASKESLNAEGEFVEALSDLLGWFRWSWPPSLAHPSSEVDRQQELHAPELRSPGARPQADRLAR